jgi:hypothetical protein
VLRRALLFDPALSAHLLAFVRDQCARHRAGPPGGACPADAPAGPGIVPDAFAGGAARAAGVRGAGAGAGADESVSLGEVLCMGVTLVVRVRPPAPAPFPTLLSATVAIERTFSLRLLSFSVHPPSLPLTPQHPAVQVVLPARDQPGLHDWTRLLCAHLPAHPAACAWLLRRAVQPEPADLAPAASAAPPPGAGAGAGGSWLHVVLLDCPAEVSPPPRPRPPPSSLLRIPRPR